MGEVRYINGAAEQYANMRAVNDAEELPKTAREDIRMCAEMEELGCITFADTAAERAQKVAHLGIDVSLWKIGAFYGIPFDRVRAIYDDERANIERQAEAEGRTS